MTSNKSLLPSYFSPFTVLVIFSLLVILGLTIAPRLSIRLYPSSEGKNIFISFGYPRASSEAVEMEVTAPLEGMFSLIEGVQKVSSISGDGWGRITLNLNKNAKAEMVRFRVLSAIREVYPRLPQGVGYPRVSSQQVDREKMIQLISYTISSDIDPPSLRKLANEVFLPPISTIDGVGRVDIYGANTNDWYIEYKPELLQRYGIQPTSIAKAISEQAFLSGVGVITTSEGIIIPISVAGMGLRKSDWHKVEVATIDGRIVTLGQIANVELREREPDAYYRINGQTAISLVIQSTAHANQIATANKVYKEVEEVNANLPSGVSITKAFDNTTHLRADLRKNSFRTLFSVTILLVFVLIASRNFKYLLVVATSLAANLSIAVLFYYFLKLEIHLYSLSGITLSLGLIIDNTLVMVDHLRHRRNMMVFTAILAATLTTIGALTSIFFLNETQRVNLTDFAWVIIVNLSVSLIIGLFMIPSLVQKVNLKPNIRFHRNTGIRFRITLSNAYGWLSMKIYRFRKFALAIGVLAVGLPVFLIPNQVESEGLWANVFNSTLGSSTYKTQVKPIADKILGGSLRLFYNSVWKKDFWGTPERTRVYVRCSLPQGATLQHSNELAFLFESHILNNPEVEQVLCNVYQRGFNIEIFFTPEFENSAFPYTLKSRLESVAITQAGADFSIYGVGLGFSNATSFGFANSRIVLKGYSQRQLLGWARQFSDSLTKMPRVEKIWIRGGYSFWFADEYRRFLKIDEQHLLTMGTPINKFSSELMRFSPQADHLLWEPIDDKINTIRIRPLVANLPSDFEVKYTPIPIDDSEILTHTIGNFRDELVGDQIHKVDQQYIITLAYNYIGPDRLVRMVLDDQIKKINEMLPFGFSASEPEYGFWRMENKAQYGLILLMALIIFIITAILFESLRQPLAVILMVPLSFIGVFITYWMFDLSFDQGTYAAFLLLGGLVVNSAIYIINEQNNLAKRYPNASARSIYIRAINAKIAPVLLTVLSTVLGLIPFVVYGEEPFWFSLATGTIGGLLFSIPALLLFLPALPGGMIRIGNKLLK